MDKKLITLDVDGVLLKSRMGGFKDILVTLGKNKEVRKIDQEYQKRKQTGPWGLEQLTRLYQGFSKKRLKEAGNKYCKERLRKGAKESLSKLKKKGYMVGALSSNPQFIMDALSQNLSLNFAEGTRLEFKNGLATGQIQKKVDRYIKAEMLREKIKEIGPPKENVVVVGDSITDLPMAELAGKFIAFRPKEKSVKEKAVKVIRNFQQLTKEL